MSGTTDLERFADIAWAALAEVGSTHAICPAFDGPDGPYMEFDTDDWPEESSEFQHLVQAEKLARQALGFEAS